MPAMQRNVALCIKSDGIVILIESVFFYAKER